jgi:glycosyltransferase involved in cell wall biosynthesis
MRVLWIDLVSEWGGAQHSLYEVCTTLPKLGCETFAAVPYGPLFDRLKAAGITVFPISSVRANRHGWSFFTTTAKLLRAPSTAAQIIRAVNPDIVHTNSLPAFLATGRIGSHVPIFWHVRDLQLPVLVAHEAAKKAERIIAASEAIDEHLVDILSPRILGHIRVIRNGIDLSRFSSCNRAVARQKLQIRDDVPLVGMVAHLVPWKRHDAFIQAAAIIRQRHPDARFIVVGRDLFEEHSRYVARLTSLIETAGLANSFTWIKDCNDIETILPAFDVLLHPATNEPFGRVLCEAMASNVPVIAADSAGPAHIIEQHVSGILVHNGDPQQMAEETLGLLADPATAARLTAQARQSVEANYSVQRVCEQLIKEYKTVIQSERVQNSRGED